MLFLQKQIGDIELEQKQAAEGQPKRKIIITFTKQIDPGADAPLQLYNTTLRNVYFLFFIY